MTTVLLDIGAGDTNFARALKWRNGGLVTTCLCGDVKFSGDWNGVIKKGRITKFHALYNTFGVPNESLDIVTLNGFHAFAFMALSGIGDELCRTLKKGGVFISAHPIGMHPRIDTDVFAPITFDEGEVDTDGKPSACTTREFYEMGSWFWSLVETRFILPDGRKIRYPASHTIRTKLISDHLKRYGISPPSGYIYKNHTEVPTVRVWVKR